MNLARILLTLIIFSTLISCKDSDEFEVPESVLANFISKYPEEDHPRWEMDDHGNWEASFKREGEKFRADFQPNGLWIETETSITKTDLPEPVLKVIEEKYSSEKIGEIELVFHHSKGVFYGVEFEREGKKFDVEFLEDGTQI